jgi:hypothetical protein
MNNNFDGYLYLVQPQEYLNSNIYKFGRTINPANRFVAYGNLTIIECLPVNHIFQAKTELMRLARCVFGKPIKGLEYFTIDDLSVGIDIIKEVIQNFQ